MARRALALFLLATGCGGGVGAPNAGNLNIVYGAICDALDRCPDLLDSTPIAYRSKGECESIFFFFTTCSEGFDSNDNVTITQHVPSVDAQTAQACASWIATASCDEILNPPAETPCSKINYGSSSGGTKKAGEECIDGDCASDLYCTQQTISSAGVPQCRECAVLPAVGDKCGGGYLCDSGLYCASDGTCQTLVADGGACTYSSACTSAFCNTGSSSCDPGGNAGDSCGVTSDCRSGFCNASGKCADFEAGGVACTADGQCSGGYCDPSAHVCGHAIGQGCGFEDSTCVSNYCDQSTYLCAAQTPQGGSCTDSRQCTTGYCDYFGTNTCQPHCYTDADCPSMQFCSFNSETCQSVGDIGALCEENSQCKSSFCNTGTQLCANAPKVGDTCSSYTDCYPALYCDNQKCTALKDPGASCDSLEACKQPFLCIKGFCQIMNLTCAPASTGQVCAFDRVCNDSSYCDYTDITCAPRKGSGASCYQTSECQTTEKCDTTTLTCQPRSGDGGACQSADDCNPGLFCVSSTQTCSSGPAGQPCQPFTTPSQCPDGYFCDYEQNDTCQANLASGSSCSSDRPCADGLYCDLSTCAAPIAKGQPCESYDQCAAGLYCDTYTTYTCATDAALGASCASGETCDPTTSWCDYTTETCGALKGTAAQCSENNECQSGTCDFTFGCLAQSMCVLP